MESLLKRSGRSVFRPGLIIIGLTIVAVAVRFYRLDGRSLWLDEVVTAHTIRFDSLGQVLDYVRFWVDNTPLIYIQTWLLRGFGGSEAAIRWPYALAGALNIPAIYFLGKAIARPRVGLLAALLMALLPFAVWYSQEARAYADLMLFTTLQMLFAYLAVTRSRPYDWLLLALSTILNLYTHNIAIAVTAAVGLYVGISLLNDVVRTSRTPGMAPTGENGRQGRRDAIRGMAIKLGLGLATAALIVLAYLPWVPGLQAFLARKDLGFGLVAGESPPSLNDLVALLSSIDLTTPMLISVFAGIVVCAAWILRGRPREAGLLLLWIGIPLLIYWANAHESMLQLTSRYYSFLYPAMLLLAAIGVDGLASAAGRIVQALANRGGDWSLSVVRRPALVATLVFAALALFLFSQAVPALANSYQVPKPDYRGADLLIKSAANQANTVVLALGMGTVIYFPESLQYYFDLWGSPIVVEDGRAVGYDAATRLLQSNSAVWGVVYQGLSPEDTKKAKNAGFEVLPVVGMTLLKPTTGTPIQEAEDLLRWGSASEPRVLPSIDLLQAVSGALTQGPNQLDPPSRATVPAAGITLLGAAEVVDHWNLWPGTSLTPDGTAFHLVTDEQTINLTWLTSRVAPGGKYALFFRCRNGDLVGDQHVYVSVHSPDGEWLDTFPSGLGYLCPKSAGWTSQGFAFRMPPGADQMRMWLRVTGEGSADFSDVELRELR